MRNQVEFMGWKKMERFAGKDGEKPKTVSWELKLNDNLFLVLSFTE